MVENFDMEKINQSLKRAVSTHGYNVDIFSNVLTSRRPELKEPYLMLGVDVSEADLNLTSLSTINRAIVDDCISEDFVQDMSGLEILSRIIRNGIMVRIMRLSILKVGFQSARQISADDLLKSEPYLGVHNFIYMKILTAS